MREALGIAGAAIGFVVSGGNPLGAQIGFAAGYGVGSYLDPIKQPHPGLGEAPVQTGRDGVPIPIGWGLVHLHGNIIQQNPLITTRTWERQGKGGGTKVEKITRTRTFAIGLCRSAIGPISSVRRIWQNDRLVYDMRLTPTLPIADTQEYAEGLTIYYGDETQLPDPELEAHTGVGQCPAYRGLAYIVFTNFDLTETGGAIPQFRFEIETGASVTVTSKPYPIEATDGLQAAATVLTPLLWTRPLDGLEGSATPLDSTLRVALHSYSYETEGLDASATPQDSTLRVALHSYNYETEGLDASATPQDSILRVALVSYTYETEGLDATATPLDSLLYTP